MHCDYCVLSNIITTGCILSFFVQVSFSLVHSFFFFYLFTIFMRAAKGPFLATIWEQPLMLGVGPMRVNHLVASRSWH